jgi:hypothetical protein
MQRASNAAFLRELQLGATEVVLSPVVVAEARRQESEEGQKDALAVETAVKRLTRKYDNLEMSQLRIEADKIAEAVRASGGEALGPLLESEACNVAAWPAVGPEELVARELERRRPVLESGNQSVGLRDHLIWRGCVALLENLRQDDVVVFVTADRGFLDDDGVGLHLDLLQDIEHCEASLRVAADIESALVEIQRHRNLIDMREGDLRQEFLAFMRWVEGERLDDAFDESPSPFDLQEAHIASVDEVSITDVGSGNPADCSGVAEVRVEGWMHTHDYLQQESDQIEWLSGDIDDPIIYVAVTLAAQVAMTIEYERAEGGVAISRAQVIEASVGWN